MMPMDDRELNELLRGLPRESASAGFSARVVARLDAADRRVRAWRRAVPALALASACVLAAAGATLWSFERRETIQEQQVARQRLELLEDEYRDIEEELLELQNLVAAAQPVVGVEGPGERGYVFDLGEMARARASGGIPVAYRLPH
jgi:hypothetical protein